MNPYDLRRAFEPMLPEAGMALATTPYPFGMRQIWLYPISAAGVVGTGVNLPAERTMSFTEAEEFVPLRGGDKTITSRGTGASVEWELEGGGISLEAWKVMAGGTIAETGVTPNQQKGYRKKANDARPFFKAAGRAISDSGGDFTCVLYRCRATGDLEGQMNDSEWWVTSASGEAFPSQEAAVADALYDFIQSETEIPLTETAPTPLTIP